VVDGGPPRVVAVAGRGRAGGSFAAALARSGWRVEEVPGRSVPVGVVDSADLVLLAVPDGAVAEVARSLPPGRAVVAHCAGSLGLDVLAPHRRVASIHPLVSLSTPEVGAERLRGAWFAVAGDPEVGHALALAVVEELGGRPVDVPDERRVAYHAAAAVASNHLVALLGQVERLAAAAGVPAEAYWDLARPTIDNVEAHGAAAALTGPVARGDWDTVRRHLAAIAIDERDAYLAMSAAAARLVGRDVPDDLRVRP